MKIMIQVLLLVGVALCVTPALQAQPQFTGMGTTKLGPNGTSASFYVSLSDSGEAFGRIGGAPAFWNPEVGAVLMQGLSKEGWGQAMSCSMDGNLIVGTSWDGVSPSSPDVPVIWKFRDQPPKPIPGFPAGWTCYDAYCNASASVVVGFMVTVDFPKKYRVYFWRSGVRKNQGWEFIEQWPAGTAYAAIRDLNDVGTIGFGGSAGVGLNSFQAIRWSKADGLTLMGDLPGGDVESGFSATDALGRVAVGDGTTGINQYAALRWTERHGLVNLGFGPVPPIGNISTGLAACDASGFAHGGQAASGGAGLVYEAVLWNPLDGLHSLQEKLVKEYGLTNLTGWDLWAVDAMSPNGRFLAGRGTNPQGKFETWWAEIRPFCYADCDRSTTPKGGAAVLDIDDFICYITHFALDDLYANCNNDADLDIDDFICFQSAYAIGC